jgi:hypothetical protein
MPTSDQELVELQRTVEEKRQRLADARLERESQERSLANDVTAAQLKAEEDKLDQMIAQEEAAAGRVHQAAQVVLDPQAAQAAADLAHEAAQDQILVEGPAVVEVDPATGDPVTTDDEGGNQ